MFDKNAKPSPRRQAQLDHYAQLVEKHSPKSLMAQGLFRAFWVGGLICVLGQAFLEIGRGPMHMTNMAASTFSSTCIVFLTALLTGIGVFDRIGQYAGAGAFVPISGFANAMVSPAMEEDMIWLSRSPPSSTSTCFSVMPALVRQVVAAV